MATQGLNYTPQIIQNPQDIGNYLPTGIAIGPSTNPGSQTPGFATNSSALTFSSALSYGYGNGLLMGPVCTYRIFPAPDFFNITYSVDMTDGSTGIVPFVVAPDSPRPVQYLRRKDGTAFLQLDYPRTIAAYISGADVDSIECYATCLVRGIDVWGRKVTTSLTVGTGSSPVVAGVYYSQSLSALFQVYQIEILDLVNTDGGDGALLQFVVGKQFGLPFKLTDIGHVQNYSQWWEQIANSPSSLDGAGGIWGNYMGWTEVSSNPATPFYYTNDTDTSVYNVIPFELSFPQELITGYNGANQDRYSAPYPAPPSLNTPDVRGLFSPQNTLTYVKNPGPTVSYGITAGDSYQWKGPMTISYYVPGADVMCWKYSQLMNQFQQSALLDGSVKAADDYIGSLNGWDGFGNSFYYNTNTNATNECEPSLELLIGPVPYSDF